MKNADIHQGLPLAEQRDRSAKAYADHLHASLEDLQRRAAELEQEQMELNQAIKARQFIDLHQWEVYDVSDQIDDYDDDHYFGFVGTHDELIAQGFTLN